MMHAGLSGIVLARSPISLDDVTATTTYVHLFAPFMAAFKPAEPDRHQYGPLVAAKGGLAFDIHVDLAIPDDGLASDPASIAWLFGALLRINVDPRIRVAALSPVAFSEAAAKGNFQIAPLEVLPAPLLAPLGEPIELTEDDLEWMTSHWAAAQSLFAKSEVFSTLVQALAQCSWAKSRALAMVEVWGALQRMFTQSPFENRLRVSLMIASYLEPPGHNRKDLAGRIQKLYDTRSKSAHGGSAVAHQDFVDSLELASRVVRRVIECRGLPTEEDLKDMVFGV